MTEQPTHPKFTTREFKSAPHYTKAVDGRVVTGIFSVFGVIDSYGDVVLPGAFTKTFQERGNRILHLWQHDFSSPPIAKVLSLREISRDELPQEVLQRYPEATGGAEVVREYLDTPRGNEVLTVITSGSPIQMSFGYDATRFSFGEIGTTSVRFLNEIRQWETSDALWGANDATVASKMPLDVILRHLKAMRFELRAGNRHSQSDYELINSIAAAAAELGATNIKLLSGDKTAAALESYKQADMMGTDMAASDDPDLAFIDAMIPHHQAAISMARQAMQDVVRTELRDLAAAIVTAQSSEIRQMREWRDLWYADAEKSQRRADGGEPSRTLLTLQRQALELLSLGV